MLCRVYHATRFNQQNFSLLLVRASDLQSSDSVEGCMTVFSVVWVPSLQSFPGFWDISTVASVEVMPDGGTTDFKFCSKTSAGWMQKG